MKIRPLTPEDIDTCAEIVQFHWDEKAARRAKRQLYDSFSDSYGSPTYFVACVGNHIVGFAGVRPSWLIRGAFEIPWIAIDQFNQGKGIGHHLMSACFGEIGRRHGALVVLMTEIPLFFKKFGFEEVKVFDGWSLMALKLTKITMGDLIS